MMLAWHVAALCSFDHHIRASLCIRNTRPKMLAQSESDYQTGSLSSDPHPHHAPDSGDACEVAIGDNCYALSTFTCTGAGCADEQDANRC